MLRPRVLPFFIVHFSFFILCPNAFGQRDAKVPDPDPELERKTFVVPDGFEVNLFAADPMLAKPIQMNFDPQGRLWVASSEVYPQIKPGEKANDRVLILEDADGDGKAEKTTVFADGLLIPTGVAPGDGGAYVADSTDLVHFSDPDPKTGKATKKRIVLSGFGTEDTHHILHTFRWGPDGCLYMSQSIYIHSHIETPHGVKRLNAGGVWRFRPETLELGDIARGFVNSWGTQFDRWGQTFATDGAYGEGINILMPGAYYVTNGYGVGRLLAGLNPGSPKHCGLAVLSGRHLPEEYQGNLITNDFRGHRVCRFVLKPDGSGYQSQEKQEIIKSTHPAFRPIDVAMGPDGAIYVADWYNPIIQHGEVDFRDPRRDHTHGRIWRISAKNRPPVQKPKLVGATVPELLDQLKEPEDWTRQMAKQVLKERGAKQVAPALLDWFTRLDPKDADFEHHRLEALWMFQSLNVVEPRVLELVLNSPDYRSRAAACRVLAAWAGKTKGDALAVQLDLGKLRAFGLTATDALLSIRKESVAVEGKPGTGATFFVSKRLDGELDQKKLLDAPVKVTPQGNVTLGQVASFTVAANEEPAIKDPLALLAARVADDHPQVRLDAVRALGTIPKTEAALLAAKALDKPVDKWLDYGLWLTFRELAPHWLPEVQAGKIDFGGNPRHLVFALQAAGSGDVVKPLVALLKSEKLSPDRQGEVLLLLAQLGGPAEMDRAIDAANRTQSDDLRNRLMTAVEESVRARKVAKPGSLDGLFHLAQMSGDESRRAALRLIGLWKHEDLRQTLQIVVNKRIELYTADDQRAAFEGLVALGGEKSKAFIVAATAADRDPVTRRLAVVALANLDPAAGAAKAAEFLATAPAAPELTDVFAAFVNRKNGPAELAKTLDGKKLPADVAKIGLRAAKATGQADAALVAALTKSGGLTESKLTLAGKDLERFLADVAKTGDAARGEQVYRRNELTCLKCHGVAGAGGQVGPDMTSIGASAQPDYLIDSLLNPSAKIKEGFNSFIVTTVDDRVFTGIRVRESKTELVLRDAEDKEIVIPAADIAAKKDGKSLMPEGLVDQLTRQELVDLTRFLSELGKGQYLAAPGKVVRRWQVLQPTKEMHYLLNRERLGAVTTNAGLLWAPAYSLVSGNLPPDALPTFKAGQTTGTTSVARFQIEVTTPGKVRLLVNDPAGLTVWVDGTSVEVAKEMPLDLPAGVRTITVAVDPEKRSTPLRVEMDEAAGSAARARVLGGK